MTTKRKVRADFDKSQPITVNVDGYSEDIKRKVQQAFFDVGLRWFFGGDSYGSLKKSIYTNITDGGRVSGNLMWASCDSLSYAKQITPTEFFAMVYEDEPQGHPHAELMMQYAEDAKTHAVPWKLWEFRPHNEREWRECRTNPTWSKFIEYRRKPKTHLVHGVEVPDLRIKPKRGENYYYPVPTSPNLVRQTIFIHGDNGDKYILRNNLCYEYTEAGKQAAILHSKAWLGIA